MIINLNKSLIDFENVVIPNSNMGKLVANVIVQETKGDAIKKFYIAQKLYNGDDVDLDPSDLQMLKSIVEDTESLTIIAKAQILPLLCEK